MPVPIVTMVDACFGSRAMRHPWCALNPQSVSEANTTYAMRTTLRMIVAIAATSTMSKAGLAMCDRWRQSSDGVDLDQPFWQPLGMVVSAATSSASACCDISLFSPLRGRGSRTGRRDLVGRTAPIGRSSPPGQGTSAGCPATRHRVHAPGSAVRSSGRGGFCSTPSGGHGTSGVRCPGPVASPR